MPNLLHRLWRIGLILLLIFGGGGAVWAQSQTRVEISSPNVGEFPLVTFYLQAVDPGGRVLTDLQASELLILENGIQLPVESLELQEPGLQVILAFNTGGGMAYQFEGIPRFQWLKQTLLDWLAQRPAQALDVYHFITNDGSNPRRLQSAAAIYSALQVYQPNLLNTFPSSLTLTTALDTAVIPLSNPLSKRSILFFTGMPRGDDLDALPAQIERAVQIGVPVNIWLVGGEDVRESYAAGLLQQLAAGTGGAYHFFSGPEGSPSPEDYLANLRPIYQVAYHSAIEQAGSYDLQVVLQRSGEEVTSTPRTFSVPFSLPSPIFLNLPGRVEIPFPPVEGPLGKLVEQVPTTLTVRILIEFPDGQPRALRESRLFVDSVLMATNTTEPFDQFVWQPPVSTQSVQHTLRVELEDERGLVGSTQETALEVGLAAPEAQTPQVTSFEVGVRVGIMVGLLLALFLLGMALLRRSRRKGQPKTAAQRASRGQVATASASERSFLLSRVATARLVRLSEDGEPLPEGLTLLQRREVTLGSDAKKAALVFNCPSVGALHARLIHEEGNFRLLDAGSIAGTWVNYALVPQEGRVLQHGDLIHLGRVLLRFELTRVKNLPQVQVLPYTEEQ